jgi:hypothetical protein
MYCSSKEQQQQQQQQFKARPSVFNCKKMMQLGSRMYRGSKNSSSSSSRLRHV